MVKIVPPATSGARLGAADGGRPEGVVSSPDQTLQRLASGLFELVGKVVEALRRPEVQQAVVRFADVLAAATAAGERGRSFAESGWLPHESTPTALLARDLDGPTLSAAIDAHYRREWSEVRRRLERRVLSSRINDVSKAAFVEALDAHQAGLYRCVVCVLMPEIERACRVDMKGTGSMNLKNVAA